MLRSYIAQREDLIKSRCGAVWPYLQRHAPRGRRESATLFRFWLAHDSYQEFLP